MLKNLIMTILLVVLKLDIYDTLYLSLQDIGSQLITFKLEGCVSLDLFKGQVFSKNSKDVWDKKFDYLVDLPTCTSESTYKLKNHAQLLRDESYRNNYVTSKRVIFGPSAFAARPNNKNWTANRNNTNNNNSTMFGSVLNLVCKHCNMIGHTIDILSLVTIRVPSHILTSNQYQRLMSLLSGTCDASKGHTSVVGAAQHITFCATLPFDLIDVTHLNLTVVHPSGTVSQVKQVGSYKLGNNLIIKYVLVVPGYHADDDVRNKDDAKFVLNTDSADVSGSTSSRKETKENKYATKTSVSEGVGNPMDEGEEDIYVAYISFNNTDKGSTNNNSYSCC
ncbi:hypothetical protein Tco_0925413 [Tanacetum coccineum]|uniref:Uncharacterized protein n=1 Tax=Tanacetum coccineum TaxID=301880 RepID=A0ABQ5DCX4_9ASTR